MESRKKTWLGLSSFTFPFQTGVNRSQRPERPLTPVGLIEKAVELGVKCVQFADNMPLEDCSETELAEIRAAALRQGVRLESGMRCMTPERLERYLAVSERLGARLLRIIIDGRADGEAFEPDIDQTVQILRGALPLASAMA